jgi:hypothetical protein
VSISTFSGFRWFGTLAGGETLAGEEPDGGAIACPRAAGPAGAASPGELWLELREQAMATDAASPTKNQRHGERITRRYKHKTHRMDAARKTVAKRAAGARPPSK